MPKREDHRVPEPTKKKIRVIVDGLLRGADAYGQYPTPIGDIVENARLKIEDDVSLDERFLRRMYRKVGKVFSKIKRAIQKVLGLFDARTGSIYLDQTVMPARRRFLTMHETGHGALQWQRDAFLLVEDCGDTIAPDIKDLFEREANYFASEALFQGARFAAEARDLPFDIKTPLKLARQYGASPYAASRRYITTNDRACALLVLEKPEYRKDLGRVAEVRRFLASPAFEAEFGDAQALRIPKLYSATDPVGALFPFPKQRMTGPIELSFPDLRAEERPLIAQGFFTTYYLLILIIPQAALTKSTVVI